MDFLKGLKFLICIFLLNSLIILNFDQSSVSYSVECASKNSVEWNIRNNNLKVNLIAVGVFENLQKIISIGDSSNATGTYGEIEIWNYSNLILI